jgi:hypothetical protein
MATILHDPFSADHPTAQATVGGCYTNKGRRYTYLKMVGAAGAFGQCVTPGTLFGEVNVAGAADAAAGVGVGIITDGNYGYFQTDGPLAVAAGATDGAGISTGAAGAFAAATTVVAAQVGVQLTATDIMVQIR